MIKVTELGTEKTIENRSDESVYLSTADKPILRVDEGWKLQPGESISLSVSTLDDIKVYSQDLVSLTFIKQLLSDDNALAEALTSEDTNKREIAELLVSRLNDKNT